MIRRFSFASLLLAMLLSASTPPPASAQNPPNFRITGVVLNVQDGSPVRRALLAATLSTQGRGGFGRQAVESQADDRGRFTLELPTEGTWRLTASGHNIHQQPLDEHEGFFTGIVLTGSRPTCEVVFHAVPDAVIAGILVDEAGEPIRNAPVALFSVNRDAATTGAALITPAGAAQTDDRGHYEFAGLAPGSYLVNVRAHPWYTTLAGGNGPRPVTQDAPASPDPSLDLVYPVTWFPAAPDEASATPLVAHVGDYLEADFHLVAIPSAHLLLPAPALPSPRPGEGGQNPQIGGPRAFPQVALLLPDGRTQQVSGNFSRTSSGELDLGGLAPGTYQVTTPGSAAGDPGRTSILQIAGGGTVSEVGGRSGTSLVLTVDGDTNVEASQISLIDTASGRTINPNNRRGRNGNFGGGDFAPGRQGPDGRGQGGQSQGERGPGGPGQQRGGQDTPATATSSPDGKTSQQRARRAPAADVTFDLPPGRYEVSVPGNSGAFLTGLTATGARTEGRIVTLGESSARLTVHLASGLAGVEGVATFHGKPSAGAQVLLIPASFGDPAGLAPVRRDQSNTDGSFHLAGVIPGQYILLAIDHGWAVNWHDPATLRAYLLQGSPLQLVPSATVRSTLQAAAP